MTPLPAIIPFGCWSDPGTCGGGEFSSAGFLKIYPEFRESSFFGACFPGIRFHNGNSIGSDEKILKKTEKF